MTSLVELILSVVLSVVLVLMEKKRWIHIDCLYENDLLKCYGGNPSNDCVNDDYANGDDVQDYVNDCVNDLDEHCESGMNRKQSNYDYETIFLMNFWSKKNYGYENDYGQKQLVSIDYNHSKLKQSNLNQAKRFCQQPNLYLFHYQNFTPLPETSKSSKLLRRTFFASVELSGAFCNCPIAYSIAVERMASALGY